MNQKKNLHFIADASAITEDIAREFQRFQHILSRGHAEETPSDFGSHAFYTIDIPEAMNIYRRVAKDPLTEAYTRPFFMESVAQALNQNPDRKFDLVCLEIESYELLHGRYGVELCNTFMRVMVKSLSTFFSSGSIMGRMDDSHVAFLIPHLPFAAHEEIMRNCNRMAEGSPFPFFTILAGVCAAAPGMTAQALYDNCLLAIQGIRFVPDRFIAEYDDDIRRQKQHAKIIEKYMNAALKERQFAVYYQPKYNMRGDSIRGAEALVRWFHPELGFLNPGSFIPRFEKNGFIFELDKYVLETVCGDIREWLNRGMRVLPVSVNVSQTDFDQQGLDSLLEQIVDRYGIPHEYIHFEITETSDAPDAQKKRVAVSGFRKRGFAVELDDFGAGYSTLSILKTMPVDVMKIDSGLIRNLSDANCRAIFEGALFTAVRLNIGVVIEGVENAEQYEQLREICRNHIEPDIQGYYFSHPLPRDEFASHLSVLGQ